jgi:hypothetical protein
LGQAAADTLRIEEGELTGRKSYKAGNVRRTLWLKAEQSGGPLRRRPLGMWRSCGAALRQRSGDLERGHDAPPRIELTARWLAIEMAAEENPARDVIVVAWMNEEGTSMIANDQIGKRQSTGRPGRFILKECL